MTQLHQSFYTSKALNIMKNISTDTIGEITILNFPEKYSWLRKKLKAKKFLKQNKNIKTVLEKTKKISGRLRKPSLKHLAGEKTTKTIYKENNCKFKIDVKETYFSPRLSDHRNKTCEEIAKKVSDKNKILVMFAGIAPWPIILAKKIKSKNKKVTIYSNEINRQANQYAKENIKLNKLEDYIKLIKGDSKKLPEKIKSSKNIPEKFDTILMPRPNLKDTFLQTAFKLSKNKTQIYYHGFGTKQKVENEIKQEIKKSGLKASKIKIQKAGDIAPGKYRWLASFKISENKKQQKAKSKN